MHIEIHETMRGWLQKEGEARIPFAFELVTHSSELFGVTAPRPFTGQAFLGEARAICPIEGTLTLLPTGPHYRFQMMLPDVGSVHLVGKKQYSLKSLKESLTTCSLQMFQETRCLGKAWVRYEEPLWQFPFRALALRWRPHSC